MVLSFLYPLCTDYAKFKSPACVSPADTMPFLPAVANVILWFGGLDPLSRNEMFNELPGEIHERWIIADKREDMLLAQVAFPKERCPVFHSNDDRERRTTAVMGHVEALLGIDDIPPSTHIDLSDPEYVFRDAIGHGLDEAYNECERNRFAVPCMYLCHKHFQRSKDELALPMGIQWFHNRGGFSVAQTIEMFNKLGKGQRDCLVDGENVDIRIMVRSMQTECEDHERDTSSRMEMVRNYLEKCIKDDVSDPATSGGNFVMNVMVGAPFALDHCMPEDPYLGLRQDVDGIEYRNDGQVTDAPGSDLDNGDDEEV